MAAPDVIVVGAGMGGLLTAAMLGREGRRVVVLEKEAQPGGRLRSFDVDGFVVDAGAYLWPNAWIDDAYERAGVRFEGSSIPPGEVMRLFVEGGGGKRLSFPWPGRPGSAKIVETAREALGIEPDTYDALTELWLTLAQRSDDEVRAWENVTAADALAAIGVSPVVRDAFSRNVMCFGTYAPGDASMAECVGLIRRTDAGRTARPECAGANPAGGVRALVTSLVSAAEDASVEIRCNAPVEQIFAVGDRVRGVTAAGERIEAPVVVCNVPAWTALGLLPTESLPADFVADTRACDAIGGVVAAAFAFDGLPRLRETGEPDHFRGWTRLLTGPDREFGGGCVWSSHHSPANAPAGKHVLQVMRLTPHAELDSPNRVREIVASFERMVGEIYEDASDRLLWKKDWVTRDGTEYLVHAARRPPVEASVAAPGLRGLYFVGETIDVPAIQMDAAALSAMRCADLVQKSDLESDAT